MKIALRLVVVGMLFVAGDLGAQTLPAAMAKRPAPSAGRGAFEYLYRAGLVCGAGASYDVTATKPTVQCGGLFAVDLFELEAGVMGPETSHSTVSGYLSTNLVFPLGTLKNRGVPLVVGGYTRMFETGSGVDYGLGYAHPVDSTHSVQFEVRDDWLFSNPHQHNVVFRVVWLVGLPD